MRPHLLPLLVVTAIGCGGSTATHPSGPADASSPGPDSSLGPPDAAEDVTVLEDASSCGPGFGCGSDAGIDAGPFVACPTAAPTVGSACDLPAGEECEYGSHWWLGCDVLVRCEQGAWQLAPQPQPCIGEDDGGGCPSTWDEASSLDASTGTCPAATCGYPEGTCTCMHSCGGGGQEPKPLDVMGSWFCQAATAQCPSPRPDLGTPCASDGGYCQYGAACDCGQMLACTGGVWQGYPTPPCP
jgi:hypothetical protein